MKEGVLLRLLLTINWALLLRLKRKPFHFPIISVNNKLIVQDDSDKQDSRLSTQIFAIFHAYGK